MRKICVCMSWCDKAGSLLGIPRHSGLRIPSQPEYKDYRGIAATRKVPTVPRKSHLTFRQVNMFATLLTYVLFATAALARPSPGLSGRLARRAEGAHKSSPKIPSNGLASFANITNAQFSSNWAGAAFESPAVRTFCLLSL